MDRKRKKIVYGKTVKTMCIVNVIVLLLTLLFMYVEKTDWKTVLAFVLLAIPCNVAMYNFFPKIYYREEIFAESEMLVTNTLSVTKLTEVVPISARYYKNFILSLSSNGTKFFAYLPRSGEKHVIIVIINSDEKYFFENIEFKYFSTYYRLKEKNE